MVRSISRKLAAEYPEILELNDLLALAEVTWKRWGVSATALSEQGPYVVELIRILAEKP